MTGAGSGREETAWYNKELEDFSADLGLKITHDKAARTIQDRGETELDMKRGKGAIVKNTSSYGSIPKNGTENQAGAANEPEPESYLFAITPLGEFHISRLTPSPEVIVDWTWSEALSMGHGVWNTLRMDKTGGKLKFFANEQLLHTMDVSWQKCQFGIYAFDSPGPGEPDVVHFDNLLIVPARAETPCTYSISATTRSHGSGAETGSVSVTAPSGCNWTATSNAAWITLTSGNSGKGDGTVTYSVAANNTTSPRNGTLTIAERTFTVNQEAAPAEKPNITPYQPTGWSDKIVITKATGTTADSSPLYTTDTLYVNWAVCNWGPGAVSGRFYIKLYVDGIEEKSWYCDPPPNSALFHAYIKDYSIGSLSAGTHTIKTVADSTGAINESNETDNEYTKTITVVTPSGPDLAGEWASVTESCKTVRSKKSCKLSASLKVENIGNREAASSYVNIYLSGRAEDTLINRLSTGKLKAGGSKVLKVNCSLPSGESASGRNLSARIDPEGTVKELDENNNSVTNTIP
jgi:hypothetical protein